VKPEYDAEETHNREDGDSPVGREISGELI
jgi:hypothetical protein